MSRVFLEKSEQIEFFKLIRSAANATSESLAKLVGISGRSYRYWEKGETLPTEKGIRRLSQMFGVEIPTIVESREEFWSGRIYGRKAALACLQKYGPPGTLAGRIKGGMISQKRRKDNPEYYRSLGCTVPHDFKMPSDKKKLAEFMGIILGDGSLTEFQCRITLDQFKDEPYSLYVRDLIQELFGYESKILIYEYKHARELIMSGVELIKLLSKLGMQVGNKQSNQVSIPSWIKANNTYFTACVRGLYDTDGGTFTHDHVINKHRYVNFGITFTNGSKNLFNDFKEYLTINNIKCGVSGRNVMVYNKSGIRRFFSLVKPSNQKHVNRFHQYVGE